MALSFFPFRCLTHRMKSAFAHLLSGFLKNGRLIAGITLALLITTILFFARLQRTESARFAQLLDLHFAMDRWRDEPATRADQLPRMCQLFRLHPHMLKRFGGEFLSSAVCLRGEMGNEGSKIANWFFAQQKRWTAESVPHFMETTVKAGRGDYASAAQEQASLPATAELIARSSDRAFQSSGHDLLLAYHIIRCAACGYLSKDQALFEREKKELLRIAGLWPIKGEKGQTKAARQPFATLFNCYRTERLTLLEWALDAK